jgi:DNA-binding transcriptional regulator YhcF (GntR family)
MSFDFREDQPIYRQLRDHMASAILRGSLQEGDALPSVRTVAVDFQINPLTASKAYQELVGEELVEKRRGLGMFVVEGAREKLLRAERSQFMKEEWPSILLRIETLEIDATELLKSLTQPKDRN